MKFKLSNIYYSVEISFINMFLFSHLKSGGEQRVLQKTKGK